VTKDGISARKQQARAFAQDEGISYAQALRRLQQEDGGPEDHRVIIQTPNPDLPADARDAVRWVRYDVPLYVRVQPDEDGWGTEITKVLLCLDPEDIHLARDARGHFLVYDADGERVSDQDEENFKLDGLRTAVSVAEDRHRWPEESVVSMTDDWELGPDLRRDPEFCEDEDTARRDAFGG
jgi:hypothetical protein